MATRQADWFDVQAFFADLVRKTAKDHDITAADILSHSRKLKVIVDARYVVIERLRDMVGAKQQRRGGACKSKSRDGNWYWGRKPIVDTVWFLKDDPSDTWGAQCVYRISYPKIAALFGSREHTAFLLSRRNREEAVVASGPRCIRPHCKNFARQSGPVCGECLADEASIRSPKADVVHRIA